MLRRADAGRLSRKSMPAALLIFALTFMLPIRVRVGVPFLFPLGLRTAAFASADYYPLLPWGALFFAAAAAGERLGDMPP